MVTIGNKVYFAQQKQSVCVILKDKFLGKKRFFEDALITPGCGDNPVILITGWAYQILPIKSVFLGSFVSVCTLAAAATKAQLQSLAGKLSWASNVHTWGRTRLNTVFQLIRDLNKSNHKVITSAALTEDIHWWLKCLQQGTNRRLIWEWRPSTTIATDSSSVGGGAFCFDTGAWLYINWLMDKASLANQHINVKELATIIYAIVTWAPFFRGFNFNIYTHNIFSAIAINNGTVRNRTA